LFISRSKSHKYEGEFVNGRFDGFGVFTRSDGMKYEGQFKDGNITGLGQIISSFLAAMCWTKMTVFWQF